MTDPGANPHSPTPVPPAGWVPGVSPAANLPVSHWAPPAGSTPYPTAPPLPILPARSTRTRADAVVGALLVAAAVITTAASFLEVDRTSIGEPTLHRVVVVESFAPWYFHVINPESGSVAGGFLRLSGVPLAVGAALALLAGVLMFRSTAGRFARPLGLIGAGVLVGALFTDAMGVVTDLIGADAANRNQGGDVVNTVSIGPGFWLDVACALVGVVALVLLARRREAPPVDPPTPPMGLPLVYSV